MGLQYGTRLVVLSLAGGCFIESSGTSTDGPSTAGESTTTTTTAATTEAIGTSTSSDVDTDATADSSTSTGAPSCEGNLSDSPALCVQATWALVVLGPVVSIRRAKFDDGADDLLVAVGGGTPRLTWVLGGADPTVGSINAFVGERQVVGDAGGGASDEIVVIGEGELSSDLQVYSWDGKELVLEAQREPDAGEHFVTATLVASSAPSVAWITDASRIDVASVANLLSPFAVASTMGKIVDLTVGRQGGVEFLINCAQNDATTYPIAAGSMPMATTEGVPGTISACVAGRLDADEDTDLVFLLAESSQLATLRAGNTPGTFDLRGVVDLNAVPLEAAFGDLDGDGDFDLVVRQQGLFYLRVIWIDDEGAPSMGPKVLLDGAPGSLAVGNFDGEGGPDIAYTLDETLQVLSVSPGTGA